MPSQRDIEAALRSALDCAMHAEGAILRQKPDTPDNHPARLAAALLSDTVAALNGERISVRRRVRETNKALTAYYAAR